MKYQAMSETVLKAVGGKENITSVTHCATRLRIDARDTSIIDLQLAKSADQALGAVVSGGKPPKTLQKALKAVTPPWA